MAKRQQVIALATLCLLAAAGLGAGALAARALEAPRSTQPALEAAAKEALPGASWAAASDAPTGLRLAPAPAASSATPVPLWVTAPATQAGFCRVIVEPGDTLFALAQRFGTTVEAIQAANRLPCTTVRAGVVLIIPVPCVPLCPAVCVVASPTACPPPAGVPACPTPLPALDLPIDPPAHILPAPRCLPPCGP